MSRIRFVTLFVFITSISASAQWLQVPLPGTPRTPDGKPNLSAPSPRTADGKPDVSGIWRAVGDRPGTFGGVGQGVSLRTNIAANEPGGAPLTPWAQAIFEERRRAGGRGLPTENCLPFGIPPGMLSTNLPTKIVHTPAVTLMLFEEFNDWRQIHTDGRSLPIDPEPSWFGYSVGSWDGDTFVVQTIGITSEQWLDGRGTPHSEALLLTERYRRKDFGHLEVTFTFDDAKAFTHPWSATTLLEPLPDTELLDHHCENEKFISSHR